MSRQVSETDPHVDLVTVQEHTALQVTVQELIDSNPVKVEFQGFSGL